MFYLDNAATTMQKPQSVVRAVTEALCTLGNPGRGCHEAALDASRVVYEARDKVARLLHAENPAQIIFTANATHSLNIAIKGLIGAGDHVITTQMEHNSVLRPLYEMESLGAEISFVSCDTHGRIDYNEFTSLIKANTKAIICTHGSNLTGNMIDLGKVSDIAKTNGLLLIVDASQTAGVHDIDVMALKIDVLCFTGHKGLMGPQGTGGMYVREGLTIRPLLSGGSGVQSFSKTHPIELPEALEAGTLNVHGLAGLAAGIQFIMEEGLDTICKKESDLMWEFYSRIKDIPGVTIYGDFQTESIKRCPIVALNIRDYDSAKVSDILDMEYGIATRPGAHCAPLIHQALGTVEQGAVRFSFGYFNTSLDVEQAVMAIEDIADMEEEENESDI